MNILYISKTTSEHYFQKISKSVQIKPQQQDQKFHQMLMRGLSSNGSKVTALSSRPINREITKKIWFKKDKDNENGITFHYLPFINIPIFRHIFLVISSFIHIIKYIRAHKNDCFIMCDTLNFALSYAVILARRWFKVKTVAIVTDLPEFMYSNSLHYRNKATKLLTKYDYYVLLTAAMNEKINPYNKPFVVVEGMVDPKSYQNKSIREKEKIHLLYAGGLAISNGVDLLIDAFLQLKNTNLFLHLYGAGQLEERFKKDNKVNTNIIYHGIKENEKVISAQKGAHFLINPRPISDPYIAYSFPSKLIEYMASGTPTITTQLSCIPKEYYPYLHFTKDSIEGIKETLDKLLETDYSLLLKKAQLAQKFVLENKSNTTQGKRILDMLQP